MKPRAIKPKIQILSQNLSWTFKYSTRTSIIGHELGSELIVGCDLQCEIFGFETQCVILALYNMIGLFSILAKKRYVNNAFIMMAPDGCHVLPLPCWVISGHWGGGKWLPPAAVTP